MFIRVFRFPIASHIRLPTKSQVRYKWTKTYKEPGIDEKLLRAAVEPVIRPERKPQWETCSNKRIVEQPIHPYLLLLSQDFKEDLKNHSMMCVFHRQSMSAFDYRRMRNKLFHAGFLLRNYSPFVTKLAFENTKYASLLPLAIPQTEYVFCKDSNVTELLKVTKSMPLLLLLCGVIDDIVLSRDQLQEYAKLPSMDVLRCQLSQTLSSFGSSLVSTISHPISSLSSSLTQLSSEAKTDKTDS